MNSSYFILTKAWFLTVAERYRRIFVQAHKYFIHEKERQPWCISRIFLFLKPRKFNKGLLEDFSARYIVFSSVEQGVDIRWRIWTISVRKCTDIPALAAKLDTFTIQILTQGTYSYSITVFSAASTKLLQTVHKCTFLTPSVSFPVIQFMNSETFTWHIVLKRLGLSGHHELSTENTTIRLKKHVILQVNDAAVKGAQAWDIRYRVICTERSHLDRRLEEWTKKTFCVKY